MSGIIADNSGRHTGLVKAASAGGVWNLISTLTSDGSDATLTFDSDIDSTYDEYVFKFISIHPETDDTNFQVGFRDGSTAYDATKTTTFFRAYHEENDSGASLAYQTGLDLAQGTGFQPLSFESGNDADLAISGYLHLFAPSDTTFVKHFIAASNICTASSQTVHSLIAGYCNVTAAIDGVQFKMSSGEIQGGTISMYGIT